MTSGETLADLGEDVLVEHILGIYRAGSGVLVGPGDDGAVLAAAGPVVISTDTLVEGRDFRREWSTAEQVGIKAAAQTMADVAAMGARPVALVVSLAAPGDLPAAWALGLARGLEQECHRAGAAMVGGDVSAADEIVVTGTALGVLDGVQPLLRSGARCGDRVALHGRTGPSAAGLALLSHGVTGGPLVSAHLAPRPSYAAGPAAARAGAHALIDVSDGLLRDAVRVARASSVAIDLDPEAIRPAEDLLAAASLVGEDARSWVLTGGEDHALLACLPPGVDPPAGFAVIGRAEAVSDDEGPRVLLGGAPWSGATGWTHFA